MKNSIKLLSADDVIVSISPDKNPDIYLDINELKKYTQWYSKYSDLYPDSDFTTTKVVAPDFIKNLAEGISLALFDKMALNSRIFGFTIFEFSLAKLEKDLHDSTKKKKLIKCIEKCLSIK